jgi:hypothetical protein
MAFTEYHQKQAKKWWRRSEDPPVSFLMGKPNCFREKEEK